MQSFSLFRLFSSWKDINSSICVYLSLSSFFFSFSLFKYIFFWQKKMTIQMASRRMTFGKIILIQIFTKTIFKIKLRYNFSSLTISVIYSYVSYCIQYLFICLFNYNKIFYPFLKNKFLLKIYLDNFAELSQKISTDFRSSLCYLFEIFPCVSVCCSYSV